ncbi:hypothetical protein [Roseibium sp. RKSG952]|uniref:hypothetical protein n=1 Tax=Roseibium sp. RKSG952 TaxID=2529384 RepID=UPI0012BD7610|nr:hypothetical protein [Roseibium sp. RKSG952]MTH95448.1 hypothetical protein [Roseibium sp. RKSG952]
MTIFLGTVRAKDENAYVLVKRNGDSVRAIFEGNVKPKIGSDIVGLSKGTENGIVRMELRNSVTEILLEGNVRIIPTTNRPDLTAKVLARVLEHSKTGVVRPGSGMSMERSPHSSDPDLKWAMDQFRQEADDRQIALNVIDMKSVTTSKWEPSSLRDFSLPADTERNGKTFSQLSAILKSGFHPTCSRTIEKHTGRNQTSINFVLPYSPVAGASGFARELSMMDRGHYPVIGMTTSESRRLSSLRQIARAFSHSALALKTHADVDASPRARHLSNSFSDAAATIAFIRAGGEPRVVEEFANLTEARLHFGTQSLAPVSEILEGATHLAIRAAADPMIFGRVRTEADIVRVAKMIASRTAFPAKAFSSNSIPKVLVDGGYEAAMRVSLDGDSPDRSVRDAITRTFAAETEALAGEFSSSELASARFVAFGRNNTPLGYEHVFDNAVKGLPTVEIVTGMSVAEVLSNPDSLADRIRKRHPSFEDAFVSDVPIFN